MSFFKMPTAKKWGFSLKISLVNVTIPQETADVGTFTGEIFNGKLHHLYSGIHDICSNPFCSKLTDLCCIVQ